MSKNYNINVISHSISSNQLANTPIDTFLDNKVVNDSILSWDSTSQSWTTGAVISSTKAEDSQVLTNVNGNNIWSYSGYNYDGSDMFSENTINLNDLDYNDSTQGKFAGGVLAPNGNIYCIPHSSTYVAIINPYTKKVDTSTITGLSGTSKWYGGVLATNGKIYCIPYQSSQILIIDTKDNTISYISGITNSNYPSIVASQEKWIGGVLAPNGKIYCSPYFAQCVLIIDTSNDTVNLTDIVGITSTNPIYGATPSTNGLLWRSTNTESFGGAVLAPNGKVYFIPAAAYGILEINPENNTVNTSYRYPSTIRVNNQRFSFFGSCLAPDGNIYLAPWNFNKFLKIDVTKTLPTDRFVNIQTVSPGSLWQGLVCGQNGKLYAIPFNSSVVAIIDPLTSTVNLTKITGITGTLKYSGGVLGPDGIIYCIPRNASKIMTIKTGIPTLPPWMLAPEFNKF